MWDKIKQHPYLTAAFVIGAFVLFMLLRGGSSSGTTTTAAVGSDVGTATALQAAQLQAQSQSAAIQASADVANKQTAAQVTIAQIQAQQSGAHDVLAAGVASKTLDVQGQVAALQAAVQTNAQNQATQQYAIGQQTSEAQQRIMADVLSQQLQYGAKSQEDYLAALPGIIGAQGSAATSVAQANNAAAVAAASKHCSSVLFGLFSSC